MEMIKEIALHLLILFFFSQAVLAGIHSEYIKGCYFLLWTMIGINIAVFAFGDDE